MITLKGAILICSLLSCLGISNAQKSLQVYDATVCKEKMCLPRCCPDGQALKRNNQSQNHGFACEPGSGSMIFRDAVFIQSGLPKCGGMPNSSWNYILLEVQPSSINSINHVSAKLGPKGPNGKMSLKTDHGDTNLFCLGELGALTCPKMTIKAEPFNPRKANGSKTEESKMIHKCCPQGQVFTDPTLKECGPIAETALADQIDIRAAWSMPVNGFMVGDKSALYNEDYAYRGNNTNNLCHCTKRTPVLLTEMDNFMIGADGKISSVEGWSQERVDAIGNDFCVEMTSIHKAYSWIKLPNQRVALICDREPHEDGHASHQKSNKAPAIDQSVGLVIFMVVCMKLV